MEPYFSKHSGHDYDTLISRWEKLSLHQTQLSVEGNYPVFSIQNDAAKEGGQNGIYLSAGIHGDECAPVWALLEWVEDNIDILNTGKTPYTILPCLNPHGLVENQRHNHRGEDLNRMFQNGEHSLIGPWQNFVEGQKFKLTLTLHEDYDAQGIYLYQLANGAFLPGEDILTECEKIIPRDTGSSIDGSPFKNGLLTRTADMEALVETELDGGYPEAIWLYQNHLCENGCAQNFETPSEFSLTDRIKTHHRAIHSAVTEAIRTY